MQPRIPLPALIEPEAMKALKTLGARLGKADGLLPIELVMMRASQINGCSVCVDLHGRRLKRTGEPDQRIFAIAAWREAACFTSAERAALALCEAMTRLCDRTDPVPDEIWDEAARHFDEQALATLVLAIGTINLYNRLNVATRQIAAAGAEA